MQAAAKLTRSCYIGKDFTLLKLKEATEIRLFLFYTMVEAAATSLAGDTFCKKGKVLNPSKSSPRKQLLFPHWMHSYKKCVKAMLTGVFLHQSNEVR